MKLYFIERSNLIKTLRKLSQDSSVYVSTQSESDFNYENIENVKDEDIVLGEYRAEQPIKSFLTHSKSKLSDYFGKEHAKASNRQIIVGAKACDLASLAIQDYVYRDTEPKEQDYIETRNKTLIIGADCTSFKEACYCMYLDIIPYPMKEFDVNLSPVRGGFVVEIGTERGEHLVNDFGTFFREATADETSARDKRRKELCDKLKLSVDTMALPLKDSLQKLINDESKDKVWQKWADKCVECGACTHTCPTCHCFLMYDQKVNQSYIKGRTWDSCQYYGFAIVAGGATPRPKLAARLRNRYIKKFDFFPNVLNQIACTGCGRCIEACLGNIDMREVFKDLAK